MALNKPQSTALTELLHEPMCWFSVIQGMLRRTVSVDAVEIDGQGSVYQIEKMIEDASSDPDFCSVLVMFRFRRKER